MRLVLEKGDKVKVVFAASIFTFGEVVSHIAGDQLVVRDRDTKKLQIIGQHLYIELEDTNEPS